MSIIITKSQNMQKRFSHDADIFAAKFTKDWTSRFFCKEQCGLLVNKHSSLWREGGCYLSLWKTMKWPSTNESDMQACKKSDIRIIILCLQWLLLDNAENESFCIQMFKTPQKYLKLVTRFQWCIHPLLTLKTMGTKWWLVTAKKFPCLQESHSELILFGNFMCLLIATI